MKIELLGSLSVKFYKSSKLSKLSDIDELSNFKSLVESNEDEIVEYFTNGETNAKAENLNGQIKKFLASNKGIRNTDFFFFRLSKYFA